MSHPIPSPVPTSLRLPALDVLRGIAVLGILLLNIGSFAMPTAAYMDPYAYGSMSGANGVIYHVSYVLAFGKFISIFAMLFGAGLVIQSGRGATATTHYRRMGVLMVLGVLHAYLLWHGDILFTYALLGMFAFLLRDASAKALLWIGGSLFWVGIVFNLLLALLVMTAPPAARETILGDSENVAAELVAFRGPWIAQLPLRAALAFAGQTSVLIVYSVPFVGGLMGLGMALTKLGFFAPAWRPRTYWVFAVTCCAAGWSLAGASLLLDRFITRHDPLWMSLVWTHLNTLAMPICAIGYAAAAIAIASRTGVRALHPIAAVGRMALSCYLFQTVACTTLFYGHGFGWFGSVSRVQQFYVVLCVWSCLLVIAPMWLHWFRFGPVEWLWRMATYGRRQPLLKP